MILHHRASYLGEAAREATGLFVPAFLREGRVPADVGDQERVDVSVSAGVRLGSGTSRRLAHRRRLVIWWNHPASMDSVSLEEEVMLLPLQSDIRAETQDRRAARAQSVSRSIPTSTARKVRSSSQSIRSSA
jgi:hypothetical protein